MYKLAGETADYCSRFQRNFAPKGRNSSSLSQVREEEGRKYSKERPENYLQNTMQLPKIGEKERGCKFQYIINNNNKKLFQDHKDLIR